MKLKPGKPIGLAIAFHFNSSGRGGFAPPAGLHPVSSGGAFVTLPPCRAAAAGDSRAPSESPVPSLDRL